MIPGADSARYAVGVRRLFPAFPDGPQGVGLLLLRLVLGAIAVAQGFVLLAGQSNPAVGTFVSSTLAIASGIAVAVGLLTPATGVVLALAIGTFWFPDRAEGVFLDGIATLLILADAAAIVFLGPGAFSIDARLFGRREILIPRESPPKG